MQSMGTLARGMAAYGGPVTKLCPFRFLTSLWKLNSFVVIVIRDLHQERSRPCRLFNWIERY